MFAEVEKLPHVSAVISPYGGAASGRSISADGRIAFATVVFDEKANLLPKAAPERVVEVAKAAARPGLDVQLGGQAIQQTEQPGFGLSTAVGLLAAIVVLLLTFGSLIAMGMPIVTALFGLGTGLGLIALFTHVVDTPDFSSELAAMIGLGVGIDYALFVLTRFREAYRTPGTHVPRRARVGPAVDRHRRARRAVRRHDRRDRAARHDAARRRLPLRRGDLGLDRRAARDVRLADAAAGAADDRRRQSRLRQPARPPCRARGGRRGARTGPPPPGTAPPGTASRRSGAARGPGCAGAGSWGRTRARSPSPRRF